MPTRPSFIPAIEGLRALAVLAVFLNHLSVSWLSGGFIGVDIFFVLSGFLITRLVIFDLKAGNFSLAEFIERRAKRLLPALFVMIGCTCLFAYIYYSPSALNEHLHASMAALLSFSNLFFGSFISYDQPLALEQTLLHTWSLGVEEQVYLLLPILLSLAFKLRLAPILPLIFFGLASSSLEWAETLGQNASMTTSYYLASTRLYEFLAGYALAHLWLDRGFPKRPSFFRELLSFSGLIILLGSFLFYDIGDYFPGRSSLLPICGTMLLIYCSESSTLAIKLLSTRVFLFLGGLSYSLYLWHQPVIVFYRHLFTDPDGFLGKLLMTFVLGGISYASYRLIEIPCRHAQLRFRSHLLAGIGTILIMGGFSSYTFFRGPELNLGRKPLHPALALSMGLDPFTPYCTQNNDQFNVKNLDWVCRTDFNKPIENPEFMVWGDSHAFHMFSAFKRVADQNHLQGLLFQRAGCGPFSQLKKYIHQRLKAGDTCDSYIKDTIEIINKIKPKKLFLIARWNVYLEGGYFRRESGMGIHHRRFDMTKNFSRSLRETLDAIAESGTEVHFVEQVPEQHIYAAEFYYRMYQKKPVDNDFLLQHSTRRETYVDHLASARRMFQLLANSHRFKVWSIEGLYCSEFHCPMGNLWSSYYSDDDHLSNLGSTFLDGLIKSALASPIPALNTATKESASLGL